MKLSAEFELIRDVVVNGSTRKITGGYKYCWRKLLKIASQNRVLYYFVREVLSQCERSLDDNIHRDLKHIEMEGERWIQRFEDTLNMVHSVLDKAGIPFLVIKTYKFIPYVTIDIDVLVREYQTAIHLLGQYGEIKHHPSPGKQSSEKQKYVYLKELLKIDLHKAVYWQGYSYIDEDILWEKVKLQKVMKISETYIPNREVEFLLNAAHILYERRYITLLDFLFLKRVSTEDISWDLIFEQADKYGWRASLVALIRILAQIDYALFNNRPSTFPLFDLCKRRERKTLGDLPYHFPIGFGLRVFWDHFRTTSCLAPMDFAYYVFATARHRVTLGNRLPYYLDWFPLKELSLFENQR